MCETSVVNPLDPQGELKVHTTENGVSVTLPLTEPGDWFDWMARYNNVVAPSEGLEAQVEPEPGGAILRVNVSGDASREQTFQILDLAVALIERAKGEANGRQEAARAVDGHVKEWWTAKRDPES